MSEFSRRRFLFHTGSGMWLVSDSVQAQTPAAAGSSVRLRLINADTGRAGVARMRFVDSNGREIVPVGRASALGQDAVEGDVQFQSKRFCYINGEAELPASMLPVRYQLIKGFDFEIQEGVLQAQDARAGAITLRLNRWIRQQHEGWYSGDIHIHHIKPQTCRVEMEAEDLDVANILTSDFTQDQDQFEGKPNANSSNGRIIYVSQEFRHNDLGHICLLNLKKLVEPVKTMQKEHYPLHTHAIDEAHAQGGYVSWAHFPSWPGVESPIDVAMEKLDGLEILCVLDPRELPVFVREVVPEIEANDGLRMWYRYLNCGFPLTATAGTDKMTTFVTVGSNRVYAKVDGEFNYQNWINALRAGQTFITNSPMLRFTVNERQAGQKLHVSGGTQSTLRVHALAESQLPYDRLEIVVNGKVVADASPSGKRHKAEIHLEYPAGKSCWVAARAVEDLTTYRARQVNFSEIHQTVGTHHGDYYGTRRPETVFAHSSPVYVIRDGKPIRNWDDAQYYIRYLDSAEAWLNRKGRFARPSDRKATIDAIQQARIVYGRRAEESRAQDRA